MAATGSFFKMSVNSYRTARFSHRCETYKQEIFEIFFISPMRTASPAHLILTDQLVIRQTQRAEYIEPV
jgi:hypothetical protein